MDDRQELSVLASRLGRWLDEKSPDDGRALFTEDAEAHIRGDVVKGFDALAAHARRSHQVPTQHYITDPLIQVDGDRATICANLLVVFAHEGGPQLFGERYELEAARTDGAWRLSRVGVQQIWEVAPA